MILDGLDGLPPLQVDPYTDVGGFRWRPLGAQPYDAIEAHLRRLTCKLDPHTCPALEHMALQTVHSMQPVIHREDAEAWLSGSSSAQSGSQSEDRKQTVGLAGRRGGDKEALAVPGSLPGLIECGILTEYACGHMGICYTMIFGYLAGKALRRPGEGSQLVLQLEWCGKSLALKRFFSHEADIDFIDGILKTESPGILLKGFLTTVCWLNGTPESAYWVKKVWTVEILQRIRYGDTQCVVKDATA